MSKRPLRIFLTDEDIMKIKKYGRKQTKSYIIDFTDQDTQDLILFGKPKCRSRK
jgi:hypothetical protein